MSYYNFMEGTLISTFFLSQAEPHAVWQYGLSRNKQASYNLTNQTMRSLAQEEVFMDRL